MYGLICTCIIQMVVQGPQQDIGGLLGIPQTFETASLTGLEIRIRGRRLDDPL